MNPVDMTTVFTLALSRFFGCKLQLRRHDFFFVHGDGVVIFYSLWL